MLDIEKHIHLIQSLSFKPDGEVQVFFRDLNEWPEEEPKEKLFEFNLTDYIKKVDAIMERFGIPGYQQPSIISGIKKVAKECLLTTVEYTDALLVIANKLYPIDELRLPGVASIIKDNANKGLKGEALIDQCIKDIENADNA